MAAPKLHAEEFIAEFNALGAAKLARKYELDLRQVFRRRRSLEEQGYKIESQNHQERSKSEKFPGRRHFDIQDGVIIIFGDSHYWPGEPTLMHRALVMMLNRFRKDRLLKCVIANGDITDLASISRFPQVDWETPPDIKEEVAVAIDRMDEIARAAGRVVKFWPLGNHDARWSKHLAANAKQFKGMPGFHLKDSFPLWEPCWSVRVNDEIPEGKTQVKHIGSSTSKHSTKLNVEKAGCHIVTNHTHDARATPHNDYRPYTLWGVNTGCIANPYGAQFLYMEDKVRDWREGFAILTYRSGCLLQPELVLKWDNDHVQFRGEVIKI